MLSGLKKGNCRRNFDTSSGAHKGDTYNYETGEYYENTSQGASSEFNF